MILYGTLTSPYVRRVRVVAHELGLAHEMIDTSTDEGQTKLRAVTPLWKHPVAVIDGAVVLDSHVIDELLVARHGEGRIRPPVDRVRESNHQSVIDGALDSAINAFYLKRDGADPSRLPYLAKQLDRVGSALAWIEGELRGPWLTDRPELGLTEIALVTTLDWMVFRAAYPLERHARLMAFRAHHAGRASIESTRPLG